MFKFDKVGGPHIIKSVKKQIPVKKSMIEKLGFSTRKSVMKANDFLTDSLREDEELKIGGTDFQARLDELNTRMEIELFQRDELISALKEDLLKGGVDEAMIPSYRSSK